MNPVHLAGGATAVIVLGVFSTWRSHDGITLNGIEGPHNGWVALIYAAIAVAGTPRLKAATWPSTIIVLVAGLVVVLTVLDTQGVPGASIGWGWWATLLGALALTAAPLIAIARRMNDGERSRFEFDTDWRPVLASIGIGIAVIVFFVLRQVIVVGEDPSWPPPVDAITADGALRATAEFRDGSNGPRDIGLDYAWSTAASIEPHAEGVEFFPRIFADIEAAESSVHVLMFGWKEGEVGTELSALLQAKLAEGVEVRVLVDALGSAVAGGSADMYRDLADAGAEIVVNDVLPIDRRGVLPDRSIAWRHGDVGRADHRKLYVIDGTTAWTGGAGIEDHFRDGEFHDVMVRVTGDVVLQAQAVFLTSFDSHGGPLPTDLEHLFPDQPDRGTMPATVLQVVPGGFSSATQQARDMIDGAERTLDIMNPYLTDADMIGRIINAAERGVDVRIVVSEKSNNFLANAALDHRIGDLVEAGVEVWKYPGAVVHAKLIVADDLVHFGTLNLDAWALYRDFEFAIVAESPEAAALLEERVFGPDIARSEPADGGTGFFGRTFNWFADKVTYFL